MTPRKLFYVLAALAVLALGYFGAVYLYENRLYTPVTKLLDKETRLRIKKSLLVFEYVKELERDIAERDRRLEKQEQMQDMLDDVFRRHPDLPESLPFDLVSAREYSAGADRFSLTTYETNAIPLDYFGRRGYLGLYEGDLVLVTGKGTVARMPLDKATGDGFSMKTLPTNLQELIAYPQFYEISEFSIKDILVTGNRLLASYTKEAGEGCYTIAIAAADLAADRLDFEDIFVPDECVREDNEHGEFAPNQTGGRMLDLGGNRLLVSFGEWMVAPLAQDPDSIFGKIIELDLASGEYEVQSTGHRNPQGLYYDAAADVIINSEHGPEGGDEINVNRTPGGAVENYGWPISSYGEHYNLKRADVETAPLHKSHGDYGMAEPETYFTPSLSPSEIVRLGPDPNTPGRYALLMGAMGSNFHEGDQSIHVFDLDKDFHITAHERFIIDNRVRDMIGVPDRNLYVLMLEGGAYDMATLGLLSVLAPGP